MLKSSNAEWFEKVCNSVKNWEVALISAEHESSTNMELCAILKESNCLLKIYD